MTDMTSALEANEQALAGNYCTVANSSDIKCAQPAVWRIVGLLDGKTVTEPVCHEHLADEIEVVIATGNAYVSVWPALTRDN